MMIGQAVLSNSNSSISNNLTSNNEKHQETMRWPYEDNDLLESIDYEELPLALVDIIQSRCPKLFYSGCIIAEIRDFRQSYPLTYCDSYHVLLKPTNQVCF